MWLGGSCGVFLRFEDRFIAITIFYLCNLLSTRKVEWNVNKFVMNVSSCFVVTADSESYACELFGHQLVYNRGKYPKNVIFHPFLSLYPKLWFICLLCLQSFVKGLHRLYRRVFYLRNLCEHVHEEIRKCLGCQLPEFCGGFNWFFFSPFFSLYVFFKNRHILQCQAGRWTEWALLLQLLCFSYY